MAGSEDPAPQGEGATNVAPKASTPTGGGSGLTTGGWILAGVGGLLIVAAIALIVIHLTQRDAHGYYTSSTVQVAAPGYAVTSEGLDVGGLPSFANDLVGRVRVSATSTNGRALFVGIASQQAVTGYLGGVARSQVTDVSDSRAKYEVRTGGAPAGAPAQESFWQATGSGGSHVSTTWKVKEGNWAIVLMNANGARGVSAAVILGAQTNLLLWVGLGLLLAGLIADGAAVAMLLSARSR